MKVLIACEFSGIVRDAFIARGHDAWSCDLLPSEVDNEHHLQGTVMNWLTPEARHSWEWELMIGFPPCTHLAVSGAKWFKDKIREQTEALFFVKSLMDADIPKIAIENPIGIISTHIRKPDQIIQPWMFGHPETKATCLWLKGGLPLLKPTNIVGEVLPLFGKYGHREQRVFKEPPSPNRWKNRSRTYSGIAQAMAEQWG
jgi:hypothetical protein